ncbi:SET domain-containing protein [Aaosphaeria arxii CBS 175.79]|uniref:SET domain-containing protein n=1 Tax=Aaosphaeria arxii CBS 175.79 TaxID=1450172 RepID=A0A6A5XWP0_9PLEO|nr:SET domain-containing protein [Aaosphaeria arxii CBS 175.79]KAF2017267.1 SET domain-containing protein [Aaosphaeria arxii CBS 175.79]
MASTKNDGSTIFLSEQEVSRIRSTVQNRIKQCESIRGQARSPRDKKSSISEATGASLMADMGGMPDPDMAEGARGAAVPALAVGQPYPPCVIPLRELELMKIKDLVLDTHHRGRRLKVKRASPVVTLTARSWTMVQDVEDGGDEIERLEMCLHKTRHGEDVLELNAYYEIKEPYFTINDQGEPTLRIDHPSDLVLYRDDLPKSNDPASKDAAAAEKAAKKCKDKGNAALKEQDFPEAHAKYTEGLAISKKFPDADACVDLARDISRNRAHVNLILQQLDEAKSDAKAALIGKDDERFKDLDSKAYYRAGSAAYALGEWDEASTYFQDQLRVAPTDRSANVFLKKIGQRLEEQEKGTHDLRKIRAGLSRERPRVDAATYNGNTEIKDSPGRGRGLFATKKIAAGEIVAIEKAVPAVLGFESEALTVMTYDVRDDRIRVAPAGLEKALVQRLISNPSLIKKAMESFGDYEGDGKGIFQNEDGPIVDVFRIHDIIARNAFAAGAQYGEENTGNTSVGFWPYAAMANHSCLPNTKKEYAGDLIIVRASSPIAAGEEIFGSYNEAVDFDTRQAALMTTWGFECDCKLCAAEKKDDPAVRKKRRDLASEADAFVQRESWADAKRLTMRKAQNLARNIDETYNSERFKDLPHLATQTIQEWLSKASPRR